MPVAAQVISDGTAARETRNSETEDLPDRTWFPSWFDNWVVGHATDGGIMCTEERVSGQNSDRWFPYMKELAASRDLKAIRERYAVGSFTRFRME
jgi:hypothetical protein